MDFVMKNKGKIQYVDKEGPKKVLSSSKSPINPKKKKKTKKSENKEEDLNCKVYEISNTPNISPIKEKKKEKETSSGLIKNNTSVTSLIIPEKSKGNQIKKGNNRYEDKNTPYKLNKVKSMNILQDNKNEHPIQIVNEYGYTPYNMKDYKKINLDIKMGGLGANVGTEDWNNRKGKVSKMVTYGKGLMSFTPNVRRNNSSSNLLSNMDNLNISNISNASYISNKSIYGNKTMGNATTRGNSYQYNRVNNSFSHLNDLDNKLSDIEKMFIEKNKTTNKQSMRRYIEPKLYSDYVLYKNCRGLGTHKTAINEIKIKEDPPENNFDFDAYFEANSDYNYILNNIFRIYSLKRFNMIDEDRPAHIEDQKEYWRNLDIYKEKMFSDKLI